MALTPAGVQDMTQTAQPADTGETALIPPGVTEMSLDEAIQLALRMHQEERLDGARTLYKRILQIAPGHTDVTCFLGMVEHQMGNSEHGLKLIRKAVKQVPAFAGFQVNLGNVLVEMNRLDDALRAYQKACALDARNPDVHNNMGAVYQVLRRFDEARTAFDEAIAIDPKHLRAWNNLGLLFDALGDTRASVKAFMTAIDLAPGQGMSAYLLGMTLYKLGQIEKAAEVFRQWSERDPDDPVPAHLYVACSGQQAPERASDAYVETEFDRFAASFERVLNERLHYRAPQICADLMAQCLPPPKKSLDLLDAGCGTGLCGPLVHAWARELVGVDLSGGMLGKARNKGVYDSLVKAELTAYLQGDPARWDAIICADTLCYFGDLTTVMRAAQDSLRPGGLMVFTVEALDDDTQAQAVFLPNGRYAHGRAHLDQVLAGAGLTLVQARRDVLRNEAGAPVNGWLMAVTKPGHRP
jgi:predicted TPR repeat methyltransferase/predicted negative regulator of RcsB-dependent stress response